MRGSLLTLTIVNLSWHAMEVSIQDPPWPYGEASQPRLWEAKPSSLAACGSHLISGTILHYVSHRHTHTGATLYLVLTHRASCDAEGGWELGIP